MDNNNTISPREADWRETLRKSHTVKERMAIPRVKMAELDPDYRITNNEEVNRGLTREQALTESSRCLDCPNPTCMTGCPVAINIPGFIKNIERGNFTDAARVLKETSALPAVCGRVCPQERQCESKCIYNKTGKQPVAIGYLERFAADFARENSDNNATDTPAATSNGIKIAVVGSGPASLSFAGDMVRKGYSVHVFEALHEIGGVLKYGIPEFRLPNDIVDYEIEQLRRAGVEFTPDIVVGKTLSYDDLKEQGYRGIFVASGAGLPRFMDIPGENYIGVMSSNEYLTRVNLMGAGRQGWKTPVIKGKRVAVIGGGNTAMDAARVAKRLAGVKNVRLVYRRTKKQMPADEEELDLAVADGVEFCELLAPKALNGAVLTCDVMELGEPDASGRRSPVATGETVELPATTVICAVGEGIDASLYDAAGVEHDRRGRLAATSTGVEGVWAAGDCRRGPATVVEAIADAAEVARAIAGVDFNKYADQNAQAGREDTCYERKGTLCRDNRNCTKTRCLGCGSVCEVCCDVCPNRANVAIKVPGLDKHQVVHVDGMCNECGNCTQFCPYASEPCHDKFTLFDTREDMDESENYGVLFEDDDMVRLRYEDGVKEYDLASCDNDLPVELEALILTVRDKYSYLYL